MLDFDYNNDGWSVSTGTAELITDWTYQGKSLQLDPHTLVTIRLNLEAASTYKMTTYLKTAFGETHKSLVLPLTDNGVKVKKAYRVDNKQKISFYQKGPRITLKDLHPNGDIQIIALVIKS